MSGAAPIAVVLMLLAGCAAQSVPVPRPQSTQSATVGMALKVRISALAT